MGHIAEGRADEHTGALPLLHLRKEGRHGGQSLVEFALCLPVLAIILLGLLDLGRAYNAYVIISNAAREGAYYGCMHPDDSTGIVQRAVSEAVNSGLTIHPGHVTIETTGASGSPITVQVRHGFQLFWMSFVGQRTLWLQSRAQMVIY